MSLWPPFLAQPVLGDTCSHASRRECVDTIILLHFSFIGYFPGESKLTGILSVFSSTLWKRGTALTAQMSSFRPTNSVKAVKRDVPDRCGIFWHLCKRLRTFVPHTLNVFTSTGLSRRENTSLSGFSCFSLYKRSLQLVLYCCSWLRPFCKQNLLLFIQPRWQLRRTYFFNHYNVLFMNLHSPSKSNTK